ncbi:CoA-binding protein [Neolewinella litorea]|uniref:CoA-binding protein n=1 Tax=Neolewinella litorea TaxID=2562452 RepID=A0A4S4NPA6_9BACT|nr:CoA-binding protein [Neolewinella litorea]THH41869.1 CoA-binding protein [Neolewinella litorea]
MKTTLILGATPNPSRYAYLAAERLASRGHEIVPVGVKHGRVQGREILHGKPDVPEIDTVTLYVGPQHQPEYYDWLLRVAPRRIIFNPGTENPELGRLARENGIEVVHGCTLVMLAGGSY